MIYLFRKNNKRIAVTAAEAAWEMYSSNGDWKYQPIYLGAVENHEYRASKEKVQTEFPINDELIKAVNTGDQSRDREMRRLHKQHADREAELLEELVAKADKSVAPPNMDIVNKDTLQPHERQAVKGLIGS